VLKLLLTEYYFVCESRYKMNVVMMISRYIMKLLLNLITFLFVLKSQQPKDSYTTYRTILIYMLLFFSFKTNWWFLLFFYLLHLTVTIYKIRIWYGDIFSLNAGVFILLIKCKVNYSSGSYYLFERMSLLQILSLYYNHAA